MPKKHSRKNRKDNVQKKSKRKPSQKRTYRKRPKLENIISPSDTSMNCHPKIKGQRVSNDTCYTYDALSKIKEAYNQNHPKREHIRVSTHHAILRELRERLSHCTKEDCWLNQIRDPSTRRQLDEILFAPDKPREWKKDPTSWLSNFDIEDVLHQYEEAHPEFKLLGPSAIDYDTKLEEEGGKCVWEDLCRLSLQDLLDRGKKKLGVVFNLDEHDQDGSHWVSMFVDLDEGIIFYYDSALHPIPHEVSRLKNEIMKQGKELDKPIHFRYMMNDYDHQKTNTECGIYAIFFIVTCLTRKIDHRIMKMMRGGGSMDGGTVMLPFHKVLELFTKPGLNDTIMKAYRDIFYN